MTRAAWERPPGPTRSALRALGLGAGRTALLALLAAHIVFSLLPALGPIRSDFANYYVPARAVFEGRSADRVYERGWFVDESSHMGLDGEGSFVPHPPACALLLLPLAGLEPLMAKAAWTLWLAGCLVAYAVLARNGLRLPAVWVGLTVLAQTVSLRNALLYGQPYPFLLLLLVGALLALERGRPFLAGLLIAPVVGLKLYGAPFALFFLVTRRFRALAGVVVGLAALTALTVAVLGWPLHETYLREVLPASLAGRIQDPYSPIWGSLTSLARRLFAFEPDLNPRPALDMPRLAEGLAVGLPLAIVALGLFAAARAGLRRGWAIPMVGALAASPLAGTYHFVLLALPAALLLAESRSGLARAVIVLCLVVATSPLTHYFGSLAQGWTNVLAYPRLASLLALLALALWSLTCRRDLVVASLLGALAGGAGAWRVTDDPGWMRVAGTGGYLAAEPRPCGAGLTWLAIVDGRLATRRSDGSFVLGRSRPCEEPRGDHVLRGPGGGRWDVIAEWHAGSAWDLTAVERTTGERLRLTSDPASEIEPAIDADGERIYFASDRKRGLGSTAIYVLRPQLPATGTK